MIRIRNWELYEPKRSDRTPPALSWIKLPVNPAGNGFRILMETNNETREAFGVFIALLQVAGSVPPPRSGLLADRHDRPYDISDVRRKTGIPNESIARALRFLSGKADPKIRWIEIDGDTLDEISELTGIKDDPDPDPDGIPAVDQPETSGIPAVDPIRSDKKRLEKSLDDRRSDTGRLRPRGRIPESDIVSKLRMAGLYRGYFPYRTVNGEPETDEEFEARVHKMIEIFADGTLPELERFIESEQETQQKRRLEYARAELERARQ